MYVLYYASMLQRWHLVWILVRTDHPCLGVGCYSGPTQLHHGLEGKERQHLVSSATPSYF
jgi:hypothetical protein